MKLLIILFVLNKSLDVFGNRVPPIVTIPTIGTLEGSYKTSFKGLEFLSFEGVPYARPPVGKYRFREPVPIKPLQGVWKAQTIYKCMQYFQYTPAGGDFVIGDEDCLYLNIYTPSLNQLSNLDVIVYIHGGAFMFNWGGLYQPDYILDQNVVFVTLNYRLGPLGFLSTENDIIPGNNGMKDQILALKWIQDNVRFFGGNPNSVTILGMSAGGASVHFHYLSPKSRGLFHRGMSQSGTMLNPWVLAEQPLEKTRKLASIVGCDSTDVRLMVECLKRRPGRQIVATVKEFQPWLYNPFSPFGIVVDSWALDPVLSDHPYKLLKQRQVANLPWLASYVNAEGLYPGSEFYQQGRLDEIENRWNELLPFILDYNFTVQPEERDSVSQKIRQQYLGNKKVTKETFNDFVKILTDRIFAIDIEKSIKLQVEANTAPVYCYFFSYRGAHSKSESRSGTNIEFGAAHGDDTSYIVKMNVDTESTTTDRAMITLLTELVGSFAKSGKPNVGVTWPPVGRGVNPVTYLHIHSPTNLLLSNSTLGEIATFWGSLEIKENEKLQPELRDEL